MKVGDLVRGTKRSALIRSGQLGIIVQILDTPAPVAYILVNSKIRPVLLQSLKKV